MWALAGIVFIILILKLGQTAGSKSLWIDEFATLSDAYRPAGLRRWLDQLSGPDDPHFPTFFVFTRLFSEFFQYPGQPIEDYARLPSILLSSAALGGVLFSARDTRRITGPILTLLAIGVLVTDANWRWWVPDGRMYGPMGTLAVAMVVALSSYRITTSCVLGLLVSLLHALGGVVGFVPVMVVGFIFPVFNRMGLSVVLPQSAVKSARIAGSIVAGLVIYWCTRKFILERSQGIGFSGGNDEILRVLRELSISGIVIAIIAISLLYIFMQRYSRLQILDPSDRCQILFLLISVSTLLGTIIITCGTLLLLRPSVAQEGNQYFVWINPTIYMITASCICAVVDMWWVASKKQNNGTRWRSDLPVVLVTLGIAVGVIVILRSSSFSYQGDTGFRGAAAYLNAVIDQQSAITPDTFEMFDYPNTFRSGYDCGRGGQIIPYLSADARSRTPCQASDGRVWLERSTEHVYVVREPLAWRGNRQIMLDDFDVTGKMTFDQTVVEVYVRRHPGSAH